MKIAARLSLGILLVALRAAPLASQPSAAGLDIDLGVRIPLRDGVTLNATVFSPKGPRVPRTVILAMTPYIADRYHPYVIPAAKRGYVVVVADVRGRGNSEGQFHPFAQEAKDGYDTIEWLARQPWSNGKIAMMGGSYGGFNQWSIAKEFPPHLVSIAPTASSHAGIDFPSDGGVGTMYVMEWLSMVTGRAPNATLFADKGYWIEKWREAYLGLVPYAKLDSVAGNPSPAFQRMAASPGYESYWSSMAPSPEQLAKLTIPIFTRTGMYDGDQIGALEHYRNHMRYGTPEARARHYLMIGPWDHGGTRNPTRTFGGLSFGPASILDMGSLETDWYDWTIGNGPRPAMLRKRVAYYVTGAEEWKYADDLDEIGRNPTRYFLTSPGNGAASVFASGALTPSQPTGSAPDVWRNDPLDTKPGEHEGAEPEYDDARYAMNLDGRGVVYHTAPFERDTEISGFPSLSLWLVSNVSDTDLYAALYEITRDGRSILVDEAPLRLRYREDRARPVMMPIGQPTKVTFSRFRFMSRRIAAGSRVRLLIKSINSIHYQRNYNAGGVVARETAKDARTAELQLLHDDTHWSTLELPVVR